MKSKIFFTIILIIAFLIAGFIIYANNILLPIKIKAKIIQELEKNTGKNASIEKLNYDIFRGVIAKNCIIFDQNKESPYLSVKEISFQVLILPLLQKKIVIPLIRIDSPSFNLVYRNDDTFNISEILNKILLTKERAQFEILVNNIDFFNGKCKFKDEHTEPNYVKEITDLKIGAGFTLPSQIKFILTGKIINTQKNPSLITVTGEYGLASEELKAKTKIANLIVDEYLLYLKKLPFSVSKGIIENTDLDVIFKNKNLNIKGVLSGKNLELRREKLVLNTDLETEPVIGYDLQNNKFVYKIKFKLSQGKLLGLQYIPSISNIKGNINFENNQIWCDELTAQALDADVVITCKIEDILNPYLKLNIASNQVDLKKITALLPTMPEDFSLSGNSMVSLKLTGDLKKLPLEIDATAQLTAAQAKFPFLKEPLEQISGMVKLSSNQLTWENLSFLFNKIDYKSTGKLLDFNQPEIDFKLISQKLSAAIGFSVKDKIINIRECAGKYLDSDFKIKGTVDIQNGKNSLLNLSAESNVAPKDTFDFFPEKISAQLKKINPEGFCKVAGSLSGNPQDIKTWNSNFKISADWLSVYGLKMNNLQANLAQKDGVLTLGYLTAKPYGGNLHVRGSWDLLPASSTYQSKIALSNINLEKLKEDTKLKDKKMSGLLNVTCQLQGETRDSQTISGEGKLWIQNGEFWELDLFKGLGELLFLPLYQKIIFRTADANFTIGNKTVNITDAYLGSKELELAGTGKIGFNGSLDLTLYSQIDAYLIKDSPDLRKITTTLFGSILSIRIGGTINQPKYKVASGAKEIFKQIKNLILGR